MAYQLDLSASAKRHFLDGDKLLAAKSSQHAGYHYGFAAECAIKSLFNYRTFPRYGNRRSDPLWAHFPELRTLLIRDGRGRLKQKLYDVIAHGSFMQDWNTDIRYASNQSVDEPTARIWREQANQIFGLVFF
jgi:hypothetical protein